MSKRIAAGWDGGGTKTRVCLLDETGTEAAVRDFGPLNINGAPETTVYSTIQNALEFMADTAGDGGICPELVIGMAGVSNRNAAVFVEKTVRECCYRGNLQILGDQEIALAGAIEGHGAVLIAGTGSVCNGKDLSGKPFRVGGYGYLIDDPGSGYAIGRDILTAVVRASDGRGKPTCLQSLVFRALKIDDIGGLITWLYDPATGKQGVASMARLLPDALAQEDETAIRIADRAADDLAEIVLAGWRKTGMADGELALAGSILEHFDRIRNRMTGEIHAVFPDIRIGFPRSDPSHGAARLALRKMIDN
jgi:N-acetylglucosamine kinase-like BadF-type ATPase